MVGVSYKTVWRGTNISLQARKTIPLPQKILLLGGTLRSVSEVLHSLTRGTPAWHGGCAGRNQQSPFPGSFVPTAGPWGPVQEQTWGIQLPCLTPAPVAPSPALRREAAWKARMLSFHFSTSCALFPLWGKSKPFNVASYPITPAHLKLLPLPTASALLSSHSSAQHSVPLKTIKVISAAIKQQLCYKLSRYVKCLIRNLMANIVVAFKR